MSDQKGLYMQGNLAENGRLDIPQKIHVLVQELRRDSGGQDAVEQFAKEWLDCARCPENTLFMVQELAVCFKSDYSGDMQVRLWDNDAFAKLLLDVFVRCKHKRLVEEAGVGKQEARDVGTLDHEDIENAEGDLMPEEKAMIAVCKLMVTGCALESVRNVFIDGCFVERLALAMENIHYFNTADNCCLVIVNMSRVMLLICKESCTARQQAVNNDVHLTMAGIKDFPGEQLIQGIATALYTLLAAHIVAGDR